MCGGTGGISRAQAPFQGLSPRVRGNRAESSEDFVAGGSIPACAGEPQSTLFAGGLQRVYPRVCGGTIVKWIKHEGIEGLSPRVRGNLALVSGLALGTGSIPACAGEPMASSARHWRFRVYPRVCGGTGGN